MMQKPMKVAGVALPPDLAAAVRSCRRHLLAAFLFSFLLNLLFLAPAIYMLQVYDRVVATGGRLTLLFVTIALAAALLTLSVLDGVRARLLVRASLKLDSEMARPLLRRIMGAGGGESVRTMRDFDTVRQWLGSPMCAAVLDAPWAPLFILVAFALHFWIGVLAAVSVLLLVGVAFLNQRATRAAIEAATQKIAESHSGEQAAAVQAQNIRALGMSGALVERHLQQRAAGLWGLADAQISGSRFAAASRFLRLFVQSAALAVGALLAIAGEISAGAIVAASILLGRALQPVESLIGGWSNLSAAHAALARLSNALARPSVSERERTALPAPAGRLAVEQVSFRTADMRLILQGISFETRRGEMLGIVGPSGSGKSTLAKIIAGALPPTSGTVRIDGAQRSDWDADLLGRHLGYLPQETSLLEGSIKDNISRFGRWNGEGAGELDRKTVAAGMAAGVHDMILQLPQGYDTMLGPMGAGVSAGQAQRVALARALFGEPSLLVLDEPNAFLDAEGEAALLKAIAAARGRGATVILIAHRHSILRDADRLMVLEAGRPRMIGPTAEVVGKLGQASKAEAVA